MTAYVHPTIRRRRLGAELRRLREARGVKMQQAAAHLLVSQPKISLLENGRRRISPRDVRDLCALYEIEDRQTVDSLMEMARESRQEGWWNAYGDIPHGAYIGLEGEATSIRSYDPLVIPGLLQTPAYARALIAASLPIPTAEQAAARLQVRLRRQDRVADTSDRPLRLWAVLDESVLWRTVDSRGVMRAQLEHLTRMSTHPDITVQLLPHSAGAHPGISGQFSMLEFAGASEADVVYLENFSSDLYVEKRSDVQTYGDMYARLQAQALSPENTRDFLIEILQQYPSTGLRPGAHAPDPARCVEVISLEPGRRTGRKDACGPVW
ncbi:helix-turn-helix transcriptional regulator [Streptomyces sp. G-G2]|uniref:helix-turn-helix domain-containing protein n=1 Tax=Streptomyces sp. G-G2 TaxID=3046201 RepID=UPI0024B9D6E6|nr:helix-turn-helix transcriptional regulator [Streptomyces sp. G-G2]MDJ0382492.1 helix-turn-helix transcriptional regulator [Streptomyces sp. G-G2]